MFDEFLEDYKYNWKMADKQYMEERYRESLSPKQREKAKRSSTTSLLLRIKWALENLKLRMEAARFPEILAMAMVVFSISLILLIVWDRLEVQNEELVAAVQQLKPKARFIVTGYVLKGKTFKELAQETKLTERAAASTYYRSIEKLRIKMEKEK